MAGLLIFCLATVVALAGVAALRIKQNSAGPVHDLVMSGFQLRGEYMNFRSRLLEAITFGRDEERRRDLESAFEVLMSRFATFDDGYFLNLAPEIPAIRAIYGEVSVEARGWEARLARFLDGDDQEGLRLYEEVTEARLKYSGFAVRLNDLHVSTFNANSRVLSDFALILALGIFLIAIVMMVSARRMLANARAADAAQRDLSRALEELSRAKQRAEESSEAKSAFLANISHELRTPLNAIIGFSEMLESDALGVVPEGKRREYLTHISESGRHLLSLINDVLDFSKIQQDQWTIEPIALDLGDTVNSVVNIMGATAMARRVALSFTGPEAPIEIVTDERAVRQILFNILSNAIKFSPIEGRVTIALERGAEKGSVTIAVADQGPGIDDAFLARLGTPFFQIRKPDLAAETGTGLGLAITIDLLRMIGGSFAIANRAEGGARALVTLPLNAAEAVSSATPRRMLTSVA